MFLIISNVVNAQNKDIQFKNDSVKQFVDETLLIIQKNALNKDKINWATLRKDIYEKTKDASDIDAVLSIYPYLFEKIEDHHGWLSYKSKNYRWNKDNRNRENTAVKNAVNKYKSVYTTLLNKNIGYLRIPGNSDFNAKKMDSIANNIVEEINKVNSNRIKGWIIDLRINTGGNMYPMIAGISDLIGNNEKIGGFITSANEADGDWFLKEGNIYIDTTQVLNRQKLKTPIKKQIPVAVLISCYTASSGEMTAISFIGRKNTKLFGEESAGFTTTNQGFKINENSGLNLAVGYVTDRNGKIYTENIKPDTEILTGDNFEDLLKDRKIINAVKWIKNQTTKR